MAVTSSSKGRTSDLQISKKWKDSETSPERNKVWTEPKIKKQRKVSVVYYLSRNGQLEHPHFMEVPLSSPQGLYLRDVINRLNVLRGKGMAIMYSWSSKRSYRNGFVWHDLSEKDFIFPTQGQDYILKGSKILDTPMSSETASSRSLSLRPPEETRKSENDSDFSVNSRRRNLSWSAIDLQEYRVYKNESFGDSTDKVAADASTQTDDKRRRRRASREEKAAIEKTQSQLICDNHSTELSRDEISPPPSDSSTETLETLMKSDGRLALFSAEPNKEDGANLTADNCPRGNGRMKASSILIQLLSCGSISFRDCGPTSRKHQGFSLITNYKAQLPRRSENQETTMENPELNKEHFSGSLIETTKTDSPSMNTDSGSQLQIMEQGDGVGAKCTKEI
ncbi:hypothetical protein L6164_021888 [Bauhinia variegata]|uniref:Uncharacterized protein n=1 Tax=Bauhinia variegata TaxID=167791 RepID=A0ACB9MD17_BAUVA|nr:hypothetical protein L6164_021888 [Bauhinia variegata]